MKKDAAQASVTPEGARKTRSGKPIAPPTQAQDQLSPSNDNQLPKKRSKEEEDVSQALQEPVSVPVQPFSEVMVSPIYNPTVEATTLLHIPEESKISAADLRAVRFDMPLPFVTKANSMYSSTTIQTSLFQTTLRHVNNNHDSSDDEPRHKKDGEGSESGGSSDDEDGEDGDRKKQKRRSKNDVQGRDHRCNYCDKTYLSYPALYTHMKNKHAKGPDGQPLININSGRGRGRPKKNASGVRFSHVEPTSENFFKASQDRNGGPVEPILGFKEVYTEIYIKRAKREHPQIDEQNPPQGEGLLNTEGGDNEERKEDPLDDKDMEDDEKDAPANLLDTPMTATGIQQSATGEKIKKKRGRKPKSYYLQQQQEQERLAREQAEYRKQELQDAENEEEVKLRHDEYRGHPLFSRLELYNEELKEFIDEKRKKQFELQQQRDQEKRELLQSSSAAAVSYMGAASSIFASYADVMRVGGNIFCTQKIFSNNSNLRPPTSAPSLSNNINTPSIPLLKPQLTGASSDPNKLGDEERNTNNVNENDQEVDEEMREEDEIDEINKEKEQEERAKLQQQISEDLEKDERLRHFVLEMSETEKDQITCDEVLALYLRHVSKQVNEQYYRTVLRFVLLYRECLNEYGWLKRREHYHKAYSGVKPQHLKIPEDDEELDDDELKPKENEESEISHPPHPHVNIDEYDEVLSKLKREEQAEEREENERIERIKANRRAAKMAKKKPQQQRQEVEEEKEKVEGEEEGNIVKKEEDAEMDAEKENHEQVIQQESQPVEQEDEEEDIYIPQAEYTAVCNADFAPLICNDFISEFMDKEHGACQMERTDLIDLTRNFCFWIAQNGLTCAHIGLNN